MTVGSPRSCLVTLYGPGNVLAALAAVAWQSHQDGTPPPQVTTLVHPPTRDRDAAREIGATVAKITAAHGWPSPIVLSADEVNELAGSERPSEYRKGLRRFREAMGRGRFDDIYYAHDISSLAPDLAMNAYPRARRITFGDALGSTFNKSYRIALAQGASAEGARAAAIRSREEPARTGNPMSEALYALRARPRHLQAEHAVLVLPLDMNGDYLFGKSLSIVPKKEVLQVISHCQAGLPDLTAYTAQYLAQAPPPHYVMLLENYSDARMMSFEEETRMYEEVVRRQATPGSTVLLKPHPLSSPEIAEAVRSRLSPDHAAAIMPRDLMRYPIELWQDLVTACDVLSTWSYCAISLAYLYDRTIAIPEPEMIDAFFPPASREWLCALDAAMREQLFNLARWDGDSILWKGSLS